VTYKPNHVMESLFILKTYYYKKHIDFGALLTSATLQTTTTTIIIIIIINKTSRN
jgi:hypothetical protein